MRHKIAPHLLTQRVDVLLVGVGGTGTQMLGGLGRLDEAMRASGHPFGLHVTAIDPGEVRAANIGRQLFSQADVGQYKAVVAVHRVNQWYGLDWDGVPATLEQWAGKRGGYNPDILITAVDTRAARRSVPTLAAKFMRNGPIYWLDLGNTAHSGNVILGQLARGVASIPCHEQRLPCVTDLFPEMIDKAIADDNAPTCSAAASIREQGVFTNAMAAVLGGELLTGLFRDGGLDTHGAYFNLQRMKVVPLDVDRAAWRRHEGCSNVLPD